jgi:primary-amine oxidase
MVVPYRDPSPQHADRTAFDVGEWGLGFMTTSLELGCDCLGEITYLDAVLHDSAGEPVEIPHAICLHEEDDGVLWKHVDERAGAQVRRRRRMVVSTHVTVANYEYLTYWRFYEDGTIECEVRATGIMVTTPFEGESRRTARSSTRGPTRRSTSTSSSPGSTWTSTAAPTPSCRARPRSRRSGPDNPDGLALVQREEPLTVEGGFDQDWASQRVWKVVNPSRRNAHGAPTAYKLVPSATVPAMVDERSTLFQRAQVIGHQLWVTPFDAEQRWPCGEFVNQSERDTGMPEWTAAGRSIEETDVVLWYVFGIHHVPRVEDWPVMPVDVVGFRLTAAGFFDANPTLDVAPGT